MTHFLFYATVDTCDMSRFGNIMSLVAKRDIEPGEEIFTSYNYDVQRAPVWYQVQLVQILTSYNYDVQRAPVWYHVQLVQIFTSYSYDVQRAPVWYQVQLVQIFT